MSLFELRDTTSYRTPDWNPRTRRIVSIDGEGSDIAGKHAYTLIAAADDRDFTSWLEHDGSQRPETDLRQANHGLRTRDILEFLLSLPRDRDPVYGQISTLYVSFAFVYDTTKILTDLPIPLLTQIAKLEIGDWYNGRYRINFRPRKYLRITDLSVRHVRRDGKFEYPRHITIWDTFAYYQKSFVSALRSSKHLFPDREILDFITDMKARRSNFKAETPEDIRRYCLYECQYLSALFRDLLIQLDRLGISLGDYSGPGHIATRFYQRIGLKEYMPRPDAYSVCGMPRAIAERAYYGGRFETTLIGPVGDCDSNDLNSAYPAVAADLPCLAHARFTRVREFVPGHWGFYKVGSRTSGMWAPFPYRTGKREVGGVGERSIIYAHGGIRWVGHEEVSTAIRHFGTEAIPVYDGWILQSNCNHKPFASLRELYAYRKELKARGDGAEKAIKLIINAVYGKLAQAIGGRLDESVPVPYGDIRQYKRPPYQCYVWAAWITSGTRARVLDAALSGGESVLSIATDGVISRAPIPGLRISKDLGDWDHKHAVNVWIGMPGIYAYDPCKCGCMNPDDGGEFKTRGFSAKWFPAQYLRDQWDSGLWTIEHIPVELMQSYGLEAQPMRAFVPIKQGVRTRDPREFIGEWRETRKDLDFRPKRRIPRYRQGADPLIGHDGGIIETVPYILPDDSESQPYRPRQTWDDILAGRAIDFEMLYFNEEDEINLITDM